MFTSELSASFRCCELIGGTAGYLNAPPLKNLKLLSRKLESTQYNDAIIVINTISLIQILAILILV